MRIRIRKSKLPFIKAMVAVFLLTGGISVQFLHNMHLRAEISEEIGKTKKAQKQTKEVEKQLAASEKKVEETKQKYSIGTDPVAIEYQTTYPELYAERPSETVASGSTVYLTFDDGPSDNTDRVLDILKKYNVKATFFLVGDKVETHPETVERIVEEGHAIGIHTDTHDYEQIYTSVDSFLEDYNNCLNKINAVTDYPVTATRHPGGSINDYNAAIYDEINSELLRRGFVYFDWNIDSGDASEAKLPAAAIIDEINYNMDRDTPSVVLMHDGYNQTYAAEILPEVIEGVEASGGEFGVLSNAVQPVVFDYQPWG